MLLKEICEELSTTLLKASKKDLNDPATHKEYNRTGERYYNLLLELLCRRTQEKPELTSFPTTNNEMIVCGPVDFYSLCPHHLALIFGKAYIGYVPRQKVLGLSKIPRLVRWLAGDLIKQEDLTVEISDNLEAAVFDESVRAMAPEVRHNGVAVVLRATHTCMMVRGVKVNNECLTTTSSMTGCFLDSQKQARTEFLSFVHRGAGS